MRLLLAAIAVAVCTFAYAEGIGIGPGDRIHNVIQAQKGKSVTLRLRGGQELTGVVRDASATLVVLGALSGREFFDAVVPLEAVDAVIIRTRQ